MRKILAMNEIRDWMEFLIRATVENVEGMLGKRNILKVLEVEKDLRGMKKRFWVFDEGLRWVEDGIQQNRNENDR
jgi:hypothetical protein